MRSQKDRKMDPVLTKCNATEKKERFSGIELLRIIAMFLICMSHAVQTGMNFIAYSNSQVANVFLNLLGYAGQIGNIIFIVCSSYFLLDSTKTKTEKVFRLLFDSTLISIIIFLSFVISGYSFSFEIAIKQFLPDFYSNVWFIPIYALFYLIHPLLNTIINNWDKKSHFAFCLIVFVLYGLLGLTSWGLDVNQLMGFVFIYFFVAYIKKYCNGLSNSQKKNTVGFVIFFVLFVGLALLKYFLSVEWLTINQLYSPILLPMVICMFNLFKNMKFKSKFINYLASCSLFVYCFHENILLQYIIRPKFYEYVLSANPNLYFCWVMICGIGMFVLGYLISLAYKISLSKATSYLSNKFSIFILFLIDKVFKRFFDKDDSQHPQQQTTKKSAEQETIKSENNGSSNEHVQDDTTK